MRDSATMSTAWLLPLCALLVPTLAVCNRSSQEARRGDSEPSWRYQSDEFLGVKGYRGIRSFISTSDHPDCTAATKQIDDLYQSLNHCRRDSDCVMFLPCDGINKSAKPEKLKALLDQRDGKDCGSLHSPCRQSEIAACRAGRCVPRFSEE
jgi:hypothetical protein